MTTNNSLNQSIANKNFLIIEAIISITITEKF